MPHCVRFRTSVAPIFTLLLPTLLIISQIPPGPTRNSKQLDDVRTAPAMATPQCQAVRSKAELLLSDLEGTVAAGERKSIEQSAAKPGPGGSASKALGDQAAAYLLTGNLSAAAWGGLKAAQGQWNGETVTNAGVYLFHLGKKEDALQFLTCAYGSGFRSPYLLEALAILHHANGSTGDARRYINEAAQAEPDDVIIATEASFINTGQPPPARPPARDPDGLDEGLRELEQHAQRALAVIKAQADEIEASIPDSGTREYQRISIDYITKLVDIARDQVRSARAAAPAGRQAMINGALGTFVGAYAQITDDMLSFPDTTELYGSPLLFWADVLGLDSQALHRELQDVEGGKDEASQWSMSTYHGPPLAQPAHVNYFRDKDAGDKDHTDRLRACPAGSDFARSCHVREDGRWCVAWKQLYQRFESESRQRHNAAARGFDRVATRKIIVAENEYLELRDFAVRQLKKMHFLPARATGGYSMEGVTLQGINASIKPVYERHLSSTSDAASGMVPYLRGNALPGSRTSASLWTKHWPKKPARSSISVRPRYAICSNCLRRKSGRLTSTI